MIRRLLNGTHTTSSPDICFFVSPTSLTNTRERSLTSNDLLSYLNSKNLNPDRQILVYVGQMGFFFKKKNQIIFSLGERHSPLQPVPFNSQKQDENTFLTTAHFSTATEKKTAHHLLFRLPYKGV